MLKESLQRYETARQEPTFPSAAQSSRFVLKPALLRAYNLCKSKDAISKSKGREKIHPCDATHLCSPANCKESDISIASVLPFKLGRAKAARALSAKVNATNAIGYKFKIKNALYPILNVKNWKKYWGRWGRRGSSI